MGKRPPLALLCLVFGLLGLLLGLGDYGRLTRFPVERFDELRRLPPTPRSIYWVEGIRGAGNSLAESERFFIGGSVVLLLGAFLLLGATLSPRFRLLKPREENPGSGLSSHVDLAQMARVGFSTLLSLWLLGAFLPVGMLLARGRPTALTFLLAGPPAWVGGGGVGNILLLSLVAVPLLWWLWGPRGPVFTADNVTLRDVLVAGFFAAGAAVPALFVLFSVRNWLLPASFAFSLADRAGWHALLTLAIALPAAACLYLALVGRLFAPRKLETHDLTVMGIGALAGVLVAGVGEVQGRAVLRRLDVGQTSLAARLNLQPTDLQRFGYLLTAFGRVRSVAAPDSVTSNGEDLINSHPAARTAVRDLLKRTGYRTTLAPGAFNYLNGCNALDWESDVALAFQLEMLERAPSPIVSQALLEKLGECTITPHNRAILDRIADPARFAWPEPEGSRRLGAAYLRFGDVTKARSYLLNARLNPDEQRSLLGGISPLADGVIRGQVTIQGKKLGAVRLGIVSIQNGRGLIGLRRPQAWSVVLDHTHTDDQGRFEIKHVPEGQYLLLVTGGGIGRLGSGRPVADNHPRVIVIDRFRPVQDLKTINIRITTPPAPTNIPPDADPRTTV